jgi:hypothetical protein
MISLVCTGCQRIYQVGEDLVGRTVKCNACGNSMIVEAFKPPEPYRAVNRTPALTADTVLLIARVVIWTAAIVIAIVNWSLSSTPSVAAMEAAHGPDSSMMLSLVDLPFRAMRLISYILLLTAADHIVLSIFRWHTTKSKTEE